jgi:hypothetical protein
MNGLWKLAATSVVWGAVAAILMWGRFSQSDVVWITIALGFAAMASMREIWRTDAVQVKSQAGKAKRGGRIARVADLMNEDELDDLGAWIEARRSRREMNDELIESSYR